MSTSEFLDSVLGIDGAKALKKAVDRAPVLDSVLIPRTIVAWLNTAIRLGYEGEVPGLSNSYIKLTKRENVLDGLVTIGNTTYPFEAASLTHVAAAVGVALGVSLKPIDEMLKGTELSLLGKSIDLLVQARICSEELSKSADHQVGTMGDFKIISVNGASIRNDVDVDFTNGGNPERYSYVPKDELWVEGKTQQDIVACALHEFIETHYMKSGEGYEEAHDKAAKLEAEFRQLNITSLSEAEKWAKEHLDTMEKFDQIHGQAQAPTEPQKPLPTVKQPAQPLHKSLRITKKEAERECPDCGGRQFQSNNFVGCICLRELVKSARPQVTVNDNSLLIRFAKADSESMSAFIKALKG